MVSLPASQLREMFIPGLSRDWVAPRFHCTEVELKQIAPAIKSKDFSGVLRYYSTQLEAGRLSILYASQPQVGTPSLDSCYTTQGGKASIVECWQRLTSDIALLAANIKSVLDSTPHSRAGLTRASRRVLASQVVLAMRLMLLARLYTERANYNFIASRMSTEARLGDMPPFPSGRVMLRSVSAAVDQYAKQLRIWRISADLPRGWKEGADSSNFDQWSQLFGTVNTGEEGWARFRRLSSREFRYLRHRAGLAQRWAELPNVFHVPGSSGLFARILLFPLHMLSALLSFAGSLAVATGLCIFMITCGFGLKPKRVFGTFACVIVMFTGLYFVDDVFFVPCSDISWSHLWNSLHSAVTNLTSLGGADAPPGPFTGAIASVETLIGYFLLSILAAMFFVWLTDR